MQPAAYLAVRWHVDCLTKAQPDDAAVASRSISKSDPRLGVTLA